MGKLVIPYDFVIMDMDNNSQVLIILMRSCLATAAVAIDVLAKRISFKLYGDRGYFCFLPPIAHPIPTVRPVPMAPMVFITHAAVSRIEVFDKDGMPEMKFLPYLSHLH